MDNGPFFAWQGCLIHTYSINKFDIIDNGFMVVDASGVIVEVCDLHKNQLDFLKKKYFLQEAQVRKLSRSQFLIPGFIDGHTHAPQYPNMGIGLDLPLLEWLEKYTFPTESLMEDSEIAKQIYTKFVESLINNGTTTACYFATLHLEATKVLADIVDSKGQRAWIGKVNMDCNSPDFLIETTEESLKNTTAFIEFMKQERFMSAGLIEPVITPRFALTCSEQLLKGLGELARKYQVPVQTHLCESKQEIALAEKLFPNFANYADIYCKFGLLSRRSIMAHGIYLSPEEIQTLVATGAAVAHCASSNFNLFSGILDIQPLVAAGVRMCLGTDVSGGSSNSMLQVMRSALVAAQATQINASLSSCSLDIMGAFFLATLGGAQSMGLDSKIGNFLPKKHFDALLIDVKEQLELLNLAFTDINEDDRAIILFKKFIMTGDDRNIIEVFVKGKKVK